MNWRMHKHVRADEIRLKVCHAGLRYHITACCDRLFSVGQIMCKTSTLIFDSHQAAASSIFYKSFYISEMTRLMKAEMGSGKPSLNAFDKVGTSYRTSFGKMRARANEKHTVAEKSNMYKDRDFFLSFSNIQCTSSIHILDIECVRTACALFGTTLAHEYLVNIIYTSTG